MSPCFPRADGGRGAERGRCPAGPANRVHGPGRHRPLGLQHLPLPAGSIGCSSKQAAVASLGHSSDRCALGCCETANGLAPFLHASVSLRAVDSRRCLAAGAAPAAEAAGGGGHIRWALPTQQVESQAAAVGLHAAHAQHLLVDTCRSLVLPTAGGGPYAAAYASLYPDQVGAACVNVLIDSPASCHGSGSAWAVPGASLRVPCCLPCVRPLTHLPMHCAHGLHCICRWRRWCWSQRWAPPTGRTCRCWAR